MRNFNNWIKSELINEFVARLHFERIDGDNEGLCVLDLCAGKGGDMLKWREARVRQVAFVDIAAVSMDHCRARYQDMQQRRKEERHGGRMGCFEAEFLVADCTRVRLAECYSNPNQRFHLVSCQFSYHYTFESLVQAETMIRNAAECLQSGGYLLLTLPDSNEIVRRLRSSPSTHFGNEVYEVCFPEGTSKQHLALFGARYHFKLHGVVDCSEFLVYLPALEHLAKRWGLRKVKYASFGQYYAERVKRPASRALLGRMQCLEPFPFAQGVHPMSTAPSQYQTAQNELQRLREVQPDQKHRLGTMSLDEWEATTLYCVVVFRRD